MDIETGQNHALQDGLQDWREPLRKLRASVDELHRLCEGIKAKAGELDAVLKRGAP